MDHTSSNLPSNKKFGLFFAVIFIFSAIFFFCRSEQIISLAFFSLSFIFILLSYFKDNVETEIDTDFENDYNSAAFRTLTTVCQIHPDLKISATPDLLEFDYSRIIRWALEVGIKDSQVQDYLIPLKPWLEKNSA